MDYCSYHYFLLILVHTGVVRLDTVDTRGLGLVSFQDETPVEEDQAEETSLTEHSTGKKKRGRPVVRKQGARKCKGRNTPLQKPSTTGQATRKEL